MRLRVIARLALMVKDSDEWVELSRYDLDQPVIRIGRATDCEIRVKSILYEKVFRAVSRYHATLYYYANENPDYFIQDGKPGEATRQTPNPESTLSGLGVYINTQQHKLEPLEKYNLKDRDEFHLVFDRVKFVYFREGKSVSEQLLEDTYIPPEYLL